MPGREKEGEKEGVRFGTKDLQDGFLVPELNIDAGGVVSVIDLFSEFHSNNVFHSTL